MNKILLKLLIKVQLILVKHSLSNALLMDAKGNFIKPFNLGCSSIDLETVALSLSRTKRFFGQTNLSVAQHSINMAKIFIYQGKIEEAKQAILHEVSEAFLGDLVTPLKKAFPLYKEIEELLIKKTFKCHGLRYPISKEVNLLDKQIVINEALYHMPNKEHWLSINKPIDNQLIKAAGVELDAWSDTRSYIEFLNILTILELLKEKEI
jgi:hypothetical protein